MKKIWILFLCLVMSLVFLSCENKIVPESSLSNTDQPTTPALQDETPNTVPDPDPVPSDWRTAYLNIIESRQEIDGDDGAYALVYIDNDDIPELYILGCCEADGDRIYSYKNGNILEQGLARMYGGKYIERSGKIINQNGHMGYYYDYTYVLDNSGFTQILDGSYSVRYEYIGDGKGDNTYNEIREYFINDEPVSEDEYHDAVNSSFDFSQSTKFYEQTVSYDEIKQLLSQDPS